MSTTETSPVTIAVLGHSGHGKTTLAAALLRCCAEASSDSMSDLQSINSRPEQLHDGSTAYVARVELQTSRGRYLLVDFPSYADSEKALCSGTIKIDGAIMVVSATDGNMPGTRDQISICKNLGVENIFMYINKADLVDDDELLSMQELDLRDLLSQYEYSASEMPAIIGSSRKALESTDADQVGTPSVKRLVVAIESVFGKGRS